MKKWKSIMVGAVVAGLTLSANFSAWAGPHNSFVDQRLMGQEQRIQEAWQAGRLTPGEYQHLENRLQRIRMVESQMRADGRLDPGEKTRINEMLNHSERDIEHTIHKHERPRW